MIGEFTLARSYDGMNYNEERKRLKQSPHKKPLTEREKQEATKKMLEKIDHEPQRSKTLRTLCAPWQECRENHTYSKLELSNQ